MHCLYWLRTEWKAGLGVHPNPLAFGLVLVEPTDGVYLCNYCHWPFDVITVNSAANATGKTKLTTHCSSSSPP